jgi:hypothetical protein
MRRYEVIEVGGKIYEVYRTLPEAQVTRVEDGVNILKKYWHCDRAFKNNAQYYFVRDIDDINYEEIT